MLRTLSIRDIVLIERLDLDFRIGLNVLTGETGAGKSILLDALGFALGRKPRRDLVRAGAAQGSVTAVFELADGHPAQAVLSELALEGDEPGTLVLRRVAGANGPARGFVNDQRAGAEVLARLGALLVEVHGQHDDRGLLDRKAHRGQLDAFAGAGPALAETRATWAAADAAVRALAEAREALARAAEDAEYLRHAVDELSRLDPQPGEDDALDAERRLIQRAGRLREEIGKAADSLAGSGAEGAVADALNRLSRAAEEAEGRLDPAIEALDRAMVELGDAQTGVAEALDWLSFDEGRLEAVEERLFAIRALARKHDTVPEALPDLALSLAGRLDAIDAGKDRIQALERVAAEAEAAYVTAAEGLGLLRRQAAARLDAQVTAELAPLKMEAARFETAITQGQAGPQGVDEVVFAAAINPGLPAGPIDAIASGGELSRFLLALKVCLAARSEGLTLIFDEIDRGVGGATADAVGRRLARLARNAQILVVTHSPQVAAQGGHHWRISKDAQGNGDEAITRTTVEALDEPARMAEIARMLAGEAVTPEAQSAARALMQNAETAA
ncbi:MAG: DNA repair protein RecN [Pseudomonadota bacterium]